MSDMQIEIVNVSVATVPTAKGSYQVADVAYKNKSFQDKLEGKKVMSFTNKEVFGTLTAAKFGDVFNVSRVKNDKGYWDWVAIGAPGMGSNPAPANTNPVGNTVNNNVTPIGMNKGNASPKSTYETSEERAARQVLIVRQSSISSAVEFAIGNKIKDEEEVLRLARRFEAYVFGKEVSTYMLGVGDPPPVQTPEQELKEMPDDLPF